MIYTLYALDACTSGFLSVFIICVTTSLIMLWMLFLSKEAVLGAFIGGVLLFGYYYSQTTQVQRENRQVIGMLVKVTDKRTAIYEIEGSMQVIYDRTENYPKKATFYANTYVSTCLRGGL